MRNFYRRFDEQNLESSSLKGSISTKSSFCFEKGDYVLHKKSFNEKTSLKFE